MIFVYEKGTNAFVGLATRVFDNGTWRELTIAELYPDRKEEELGCVYMEDSIKYSLDPDGWMFELDEKGTPSGVVRKTQPYRIVLSTDAVDTDGDGLPELAADGSSEAKITITLLDGKDKKPRKAYPVKVSTTGGRLSARILKTRNGVAEVSLRSVTETITITVTVQVQDVGEESLTFELMPS